MNRDFIAHRYRVLDTIGGGDPPRVFKVEDLAYGMRKALKLAGSKEEQRNLIQEYRNLALLRHPGIVSVYDLTKTASGDLILTMEYVTGAPLVALRSLQRGGFQRLMEVSLQVFEALSVIHARGWVHRELKPGNIILARAVEGSRDPDYIIRILDFALSCPVGSPTITEEGPRVSGTPDYQSPEELRGEPVDQRADLFTVGVILYEALTGSNPYRRDSLLGITSAHQGRPPAGPRRLNRSVPRAFSDVVQELVHPDPEARPFSAEEVIDRIGRGMRGPRYRPRSPLSLGSPPIPRQEEATRTVLDRLDRARDGVPGAVLVQGPVGSGKSEWIRRLRSEIQLAGGDCWVTDSLRWGAHPFGPVREILNRGLSERQGEWILASARRWLRRLIPELSQRTLRAGEQKRTLPNAQEIFRNALLDALIQLARGQSGRNRRVRPLVVILENLDRADQDTLDFVRRGLRLQADGDPIPLVLVATENADSGVEFPCKVVFPPLPREDMRAYLGSSLGERKLPTELLESLIRDAEGNPGSLRHRVQDLAETGRITSRRDRLELEGEIESEPLEAILQRRADPRSQLERSILWIAAVIGVDFRLSQLLEVGRMEPTVTTAALAGLLRTGLLAARFDGRTVNLGFAHPDLARIVYASIPENERRNLHRFVARHLERRLRREGADLAAMLAEHFLAAGNDRKALHYAMEAGARAQETFSYSDAVGHYRQALEILLRSEDRDILPDLRRSLTDVLTGAGRLEEARQVAEEALTEARSAGLPKLVLGRFHHAIARIALRSGEPAESEEHYRLALESLSDRWDPRTAALLRVELAELLTKRGELQEALDLAEAALETLRSDQGATWETGRAYLCFGHACQAADRIEDAEAGHRMASSLLLRADDLQGVAEAQIALGRLAVRRGEAAEARETYLEALETTRESSDLGRMIEIYLSLGTLEAAAGETDREEAYYREALRLARRTGHVREEIAALTGLGVHDRRCGRSRSAEEQLRAAEQLAEAQGLRAERARLLLNRGFLLRQLGRLKEARSLLEESLKLLRDEDHPAGMAACHAHLASILREVEEWDEAIRHLEEAARLYGKDGSPLALASIQRQLGEVHLAREQVDEAEDRASSAMEQALSSGNPREIGLARTLLGRVLQRQGRQAAARSLLSEAIQSLERAGDAYGSSRARLSLASALSSAGDPLRAQNLAERALEGFRSLGAEADQAEARSLLVEIQASPRKTEAVQAGVTLELLENLSGLVDALNDPEQLAAQLMGAFLTLSSGRRALLLRPDTAHSTWHVAGSVRVEPEIVQEVTELVQGELVDQLEPVFMTASDLDPRFAGLAALRPVEGGGTIWLPLLHEEELLGVLFLETARGDRFEDAWVREELGALGKTAGVVLRQADRQVEALETAANTGSIEYDQDLETLPGHSEAAREAGRTAAAALATSAPILIRGESGVGKRYLAEAMLRQCTGRSSPLLTLSCRNLPASILELELFGGARTGVGELNRGRSYLESAEGGVLLLIDLEQMSTELQRRLALAFTTGTVQRADGESGTVARVRLIATTERDPATHPGFDPELLKLLSPLQILLPPLRERLEDVPILAARLLTELSASHPRSILGFEPEAEAALLRYGWPGNLDELRATIEQALLQTPGPRIRLEDLDEKVRLPPSRPVHDPQEPSRTDEPLPDTPVAETPVPEEPETLASLAEMEEAHIRRVLESVDGKKVAACRILGISRPTLDRKIKVYGIPVTRRRSRGGA